jgi:hypothetical protein
MTKRPSVSLGRERYLELLDAAGIELVGERSDEGENHYYLTRKSMDASRGEGRAGQ